MRLHAERIRRAIDRYSQFDESKHPRGQQANAGQFAPANSDTSNRKGHDGRDFTPTWEYRQRGRFAASFTVGDKGWTDRGDGTLVKASKAIAMVAWMQRMSPKTVDMTDSHEDQMAIKIGHKLQEAPMAFSFENIHTGYGEGESNAHGITGTGNAREAVVKAGACLIKAIEKYQPKVVYYTAKERSRKGLYDLLTKKAIHQLGYSGFRTESDDKSIFVLVRNDSVADFKEATNGMGLVDYESGATRHSRIDVAVMRYRFNSEEHPRGQPKNKGQFTAKPQTSTAAPKDKPKLESTEDSDLLQLRRELRPAELSDAEFKTAVSTAEWNDKLREVEQRTGREWDDIVDELVRTCPLPQNADEAAKLRNRDDQFAVMEQMIADHGDKPLAWELPDSLNPKDHETPYDGEPPEKHAKRLARLRTRWESRNKIRGFLAKANVSNKYKAVYLHRAGEVMTWMTDSALKMFSENVRDAKFYETTTKLTNALGWHGSGQIGGAWTGTRGSGAGKLSLNGNTSDLSTREVYAHEFGHACDWMEGTETVEERGTFHSRPKPISKTDEWQEAFHKELSGGDLSLYAATVDYEGFAEFARLVWGTGMRHSNIEETYPLCYAVFKKHGLV